MSSVLLCNFTAIPADAEEEFNAWYDSEHVPRLAALPGVRRARRYRSAEQKPAYLALYELDQAQVAQGDAWLTAARTPWTAWMKRFTRDYRSFLFEPLP
ncbi:DUF4286 family protein [Parasphingopyxis marina]|nr:DUF4286 family protein [Parasphingopyxis marina]